MRPKLCFTFTVNDLLSYEVSICEMGLLDSALNIFLCFRWVIHRIDKTMKKNRTQQFRVQLFKVSTNPF